MTTPQVAAILALDNRYAAALGQDKSRMEDVASDAIALAKQQQAEIEAFREVLAEAYEWLYESKADGPRISEGALQNGAYTPEFEAFHERLRAALTQQTQGEGHEQM